MDSKYSISEPQEVLSSDYLGTFLIRQNANQYACKKKTDTEEWWAIGMIANDGTYWHPLIVSNTEAYCYSYSDNYNNGNPLSNKTASFDYNGTMYYASFGAYGSIGGSVSTNVSIPVYSETKSSDISHMAQILLGLHLQDGGTLPSGEDSSGNYQKVDYLRINWENKSESLKTPIDKGNLNKMDKAIDDLCKNLDVAHTESEVKKLDKSSANKLLSETPTWDAETGILTFKFFDGTSFNVDFNVEKIPVSFSMDSNGVITMTTDDGTEWTADVSKLIQDYNFNNGLRISFTKTKNEDGYEVSADLVKGSITEEYLEENYLANIISNVNASNTNATNAATSATNAANDAKLAQSYAIGSSGIRDGEDTDNAKYYSQQASKAKQEILDSMNIAGRGLTVEYDADSQRNVFALARECVQITDWNTQFYTGFYGSSVSANGVPSDAANYGTAFFGIVLQATDSANRSSVVYQTGIVYKNSRTDFSGIKKYERVYAQGQWSSWEDTNSFRDEDKTNLDNLVLQIGNHYVKKDVPENAAFTDTVYDDTEVQKRISDNGYGEIAGGKNLAKSYKIATTAERYYTALSVDANLQPSTTYTISFIGASNYIGYPNEFIFIAAKPFTCNGERQSITLTTKESLPEDQRVYPGWLFFKNSKGNTVMPSFTDVQIELGSEATSYEPYFPSNKMLSEEKADKSETTVNLLNPTLETTTKNGVTCTNNGDGTYTLKGTASENAIFKLSEFNVTDSVRMIGCPKDGNVSTFKLSAYADQYPVNDIGNGASLDIHMGKTVEIRFVVYSGTTIVNKVFKPMITTNLNATYDDFVPYTGDSSSLNGDVADLRENVDNLVELGEDITD
uniref:Uncharacterized protein n=1 Tax=virus sp. ctQmo6 TaxID=2827990 RepID=A0A8S5RGB8_9VIRU|nr:MAG TPA: hypothetical protein [virus sp. ctQmo6]